MAWMERLVGIVAIGLVVTAVIRELGKPARDRHWRGEVAGFVPYDFRPPTLDRIQRAWWNPGDPRLLTGTAFGVGWAVNLARLVGRGH